MKASLLIASVALAALPGCRDDTVDLGYRLNEGDRLTYRLNVSAAARWDIGGPGGGDYKAEFSVTEEVTESGPEGVVVSVDMEPTEVIENGLPSPGPETRSFRLRLDAAGAVLDVLEVEGLPPRALEPDELAFIGTYRPPLPIESVRLHDRWEAERGVIVEDVAQQITVSGVLDVLRLHEGRDAAEILYSGEGPLQWRTRLPQGTASLEGAAQSRGEALFDIEGGFIRSARTLINGRFAVRVIPETAEAPITGTLDLTLELVLSLVGSHNDVDVDGG